MRPFAAAILTMSVGLASCTTLDPSDAGNLVPKTVDEDPSIPSIELAGTKLHLEAFGEPSSPVVIFLHGGPGGDARDMLRLLERHDGYALTDDHRVITWDQRGSGLSRRHDCSVFTRERLDADLDALVDLVSPGRPVVLVGYSWGGMYATDYIGHHPQKVAGAVLIEPGPLNSQLFDQVKDDIYRLDLFSEGLNDIVWDDQFISPDDHARADYSLVVGMRNSEPKFHMRLDHDPAPVWRLGAVANRCITQLGIKDGKADYDFAEHLSAFKTRVRFIASAKNEVIGAAFQEKQRVLYPSSDLVVIEGAGHDAPWTQPALVAGAIHSYLLALGASGAVQ